MKKSILLIFLLALPFLSFAQRKGYGSKAQFTVLTEVRAVSNIVSTAQMESYDWTVSPGCTFANGLSLRIPIDLAIMTFPNAEPIKTYESVGTFGLNVGYDFLPKKDEYCLELNVSGGSTYLKSMANYAYADLSLKFGVDVGKAIPFLSVGARYYIPYSGVLKENVYFHFGFGVWMF